MTSPERQIAVNHQATSWLSELLERWDLDAPADRAAFIVRELLALGIARVPRVPRVPPLQGPSSTEAGRAAARALFEETRRLKAGES